MHGIRTRHVEVDKVVVVLAVDNQRPDGVSHAQYDSYLKNTSLVSANQGKAEL